MTRRRHIPALFCICEESPQDSSGHFLLKQLFYVSDHLFFITYFSLLQSGLYTLQSLLLHLCDPLYMDSQKTHFLLKHGLF